MKVLAMTLEMMARVALYATVMAMTIRSLADRRRPEPAKRPQNSPKS